MHVNSHSLFEILSEITNSIEFFESRYRPIKNQSVRLYFEMNKLVINISAHAHTAAPIRTCGCGVGCGIFGIFNVWVGCGVEWLKNATASAL